MLWDTKESSGTGKRDEGIDAIEVIEKTHGTYDRRCRDPVATQVNELVRDSVFKEDFLQGFSQKELSRERQTRPYDRRKELTGTRPLSEGRR